MATIVATLALVLIAALAGAAQMAEAAAPSPITVTAGGWVRLPLSGVVRADTNPADTAVAWAGTDAVTIYGLLPGTSVLILTTPDSIEARPVRVAAGPWDTVLPSDSARCPARGYVTPAGQSRLVLDAPGLTGDWTPGSWRLEWTPADARVSASSALATPLEQLGVPVAPGLEADWHDRWQLIASEAFGLIGYHVPGAGTVAFGESGLGPAGLMEATLGDVRVSTAAVMSQGQLVTAAQANVKMGPLEVGYATGPAGGSPTVGYRGGSVSVAAATFPGQGVQVGLGLSPAPGVTIDGSWTTAGGWRAQVAIPIDGGPVSNATSGAANPNGACGP